jgi:TolB-like protein
MDRPTFLQRLKERKFLHWGFAYAAAAFVVYQAVEVMADPWNISSTLRNGIHVLLALGFFLTLTLAWYHGRAGRQDVTGPELLLLAVFLLVGGSALTLVRTLNRRVSLPPGFTVTAGEERNLPPGEGRGSLEDLIAATLSEEGASFAASIAVLPVDNQTGDPSFDALCTGITDELIARLSQNPNLKVIDRNSVQYIQGLGLTLQEVADTLAVDHILEGGIYPFEDFARLRVRLVEARTETPLWANNYSLDLTNQLRALEEVSDEIRDALLTEVPTLRNVRSAYRITESPGYVSYLAGNRLLATRTRSGIIRAIEAYRTAIGFDSAFAPAYAGLSSAYALSITYRYRIDRDAYAAAGISLRAADSAVALDPNLADAFAARGYISSVALAPAQRVHSDFARAMELQPNAPNVPAWYANLLVREGFYEEALAQARRAVELDPFSPARRTGLAYEALRARRYALADSQAQAAVALQADVVLPLAIRARALLLNGHAQGCLDLELGPHAGIRAMCLHAVGRVREATTIVDSLRSEVVSGTYANPEFTTVVPVGDLASFLAWTGDPERALPWIERAFTLSPSGIDPRVLESALFDHLFQTRALRSAVEQIRNRVWDRVQREAVEAPLDP